MTDISESRPLAVTPLQAASLLALRVTTGFLLIWWGLAKAMNPGLGNLVSNTFYGGLFSFEMLQLVFGIAQTALGALVVLGLFRRVTLPLQLVINAFTALSVWYALIDPFGWYLPVERPFQFSHLFYPSAIVVAACVLLIAFRSADRYALDNR